MRTLNLVIFAGLAACAAAARAQPVVFQDDFSDASRTAALWGNERGAWVVDSGTYGASQPTNQPPTFSSVPYILTDFEIECDLIAADDGGIWLRADAAGLNGVLLVFARGNVYWHNMANGNAGAVINQASGVFSTGNSLHVRVVVTGSSYAAYVNGSLVTTYTDATHPTGRVAFYDFRSSNHNYDNVIVRGACASGDCCAIAYASPAGTAACPGASESFHADVSGNGPFTYQWQVQDPALSGLWVDAPEGDYPPMNLSFANTHSPDCTVTSGTSGGAAVYTSQFVRCIATNTCTPSTSPPAEFVALRCCPDANQDGNVDQDDIGYLINVVGGGDNPTNIDPDFNHDGNVDQDDVGALINVVAGGDCP